MLTFYHHPYSSNAQKVRLLLEEMGVPFQPVLVNLQKGEQSLPPFLAINPFGAVPAIDHDGFPLAESNTILRYLAQVFGQKELYPDDLKDRARIDQAMDFTSAHISRWLAILNWHQVIAPMMDLPSNPQAIKEAEVQLQRYLPKLERSLKTAKPFIAGPHYTIADISFVPLLAQALRLEVDFHAHPLVHAYAERVLDRPAWKKVEETMRPVSGS